MPQRESNDFHASVGETISMHLKGVVDPEFLSPHEAMQPLYQIYGTALTRSDIGRLTTRQRSQIAQAYKDYFEVDAITDKMVEDFLQAALRQWEVELPILEDET